MHFHLLLAISMTIGGQPTIEPVRPEMTALAGKRDILDMPADHFYLVQHASRIDDRTRDAYFARLDRYLADAVDCSNPAKIGWLLEMAYRTHPSLAVRAVVAPSINKLILERPSCFLAGVERTVHVPAPGDVFDRFVLESETADPRSLRDALLPVLSRPGFAPLEEIFDQRTAVHLEQLQREEEARQRGLAMQRRKYRAVLQEAAFLNSEPREYWSRWNIVSGTARTCEETEVIADLLDAAVMHAKNGRRTRSAEFIEMLVIDNPSCVLHGMTQMRDWYAFSRYLLEPVMFSPDELLASLAGADVDGEAAKHRQSAQQALLERRRNRLAAMTSDARFLWNASITYGHRNGYIFVEPMNFTGASDISNQVEALWAEATPAGTHGHGHEVRVLSLEAIDFLTGGRYPSYQLLHISPQGVAATKARPTGAAILEWFCEGKILMLQLSPESSVENGEWQWAAFALHEDLPLPDVSDFRRASEEWFTYGRLSWPSAGRSMDFKYSDSFTDTILQLEDRQTGETRFANQTGWSCH